ncbi:terminase [Altererythrobacter sp. B11]|uniref:terminase large subunit n=1 Tax=Altererythrobacter sp. B11 TaxID=2060312 RepID=UPI000DC7081D|nr:terminase TerL endonuclease subunit [Altererythrobacter sp. B11]BBC74401.1 terminase [Altererythrobacter sp. B11]
MGKRGPGAARQIAAGAGARQAAQDLFNPAPAAPAPHPWEAEGLTRAERVIAFLEDLPVTKGFGEGEKVRLEPFQREWLQAIYGDRQDGRRQVRRGLLSVARGNGKTVLCAGLSLCHLIGPEAERRGECYSAAAVKEQAALIFAEMEATIMATPWMAARVNIKAFTKEITDPQTGSIYRALASDGKSVHGLASSFIVCDELAQWGKRELYDVLATSMGKRAEPLMLVIGTQSPRAENIMSELVDYAARIDSGEIEDPSFHGRVYAVPEDADPFDPKNWPLANPALGKFRSAEELAQEAKRASRMPTFEPAFRNLYCNQRVDAEPKAINPAEWELCGGAFDLAALAGRPCYAGLDLSSTRDLSALALYFPEDGGALVLHAWCPKENLADREETDRVPYRVWSKQGHIEATPGRAIDKRFIAARLAEVRACYDLRGVAFDRWGMADLKAILSSEGIDLPLVDWGQGYRDMGPAVDAFEIAMLEGKLRHAMHPVLRWSAGNLVYETDPAGLRKPSKNRSIDRIDPMVATIMACGLASRQEGTKTYRGQGIVWL